MKNSKERLENLNKKIKEIKDLQQKQDHPITQHDFKIHKTNLYKSLANHSTENAKQSENKEVHQHESFSIRRPVKVLRKPLNRETVNKDVKEDKDFNMTFGENQIKANPIQESLKPIETVYVERHEDQEQEQGENSKISDKEPFSMKRINITRPTKQENNNKVTGFDTTFGENKLPKGLSQSTRKIKLVLPKSIKFFASLKKDAGLE